MQLLDTVQTRIVQHNIVQGAGNRVPSLALASEPGADESLSLEIR
jgi:hypothetical protein